MAEYAEEGSAVFSGLRRRQGVSERVFVRVDVDGADGTVGLEVRG
jgi:hypothetical protein